MREHLKLTCHGRRKILEDLEKREGVRGREVEGEGRVNLNYVSRERKNMSK